MSRSTPLRSALPKMPTGIAGFDEPSHGGLPQHRISLLPVPAVTTVVVMCLYIADSAPNSVQAIANLEAICNEHLKGNFRLEIVDVLESPQRALADGILVTPSLAKLSPFPAAQVIGNLSDKASVLRALGIKEAIT